MFPGFFDKISIRFFDVIFESVQTISIVYKSSINIKSNSKVDREIEMGQGLTSLSISFIGHVRFGLACMCTILSIKQRLTYYTLTLYIR